MEPSPTRLFLAAVPDAASRRGLEHLQTLLRAAWPGAPGVRWTLPADLHLTLRYLGAASPGQRAGIAALAARTMVGPRRFELQPGVLAAWPARRPRLLVLEYPGPPELAHLVAELEAGATPPLMQPGRTPDAQLSLLAAEDEALLRDLAVLDPDGMTPIEALQRLYDLRAEARRRLAMEG